MNTAALDNALEGRSIIRVAQLQARVSDVPSADHKAQLIAASAGGYVSGEQASLDPAHPDRSSATVVLRVPGNQLSSVLGQLGQIGTVLSQTQSANDVTSDVVDVAARIDSQRASVARVRALLARAKTIGEIVSIEGELTSRESDLESLEARQKALADSTALATVTATFVGRTVTGPPAQATGGFFSGLHKGWLAFSKATQTLLTAIGAVLPFAIFAFIVWLGLRAVLRRRRPPAPAEPVEV